MTVAELQQRMSSRELAEWQVFCRIENEELDKRQQRASVERGAEAQARKALRR